MNNVDDGQLEFTLASVVGSGKGRSCEVRDSMERKFKGFYGFTFKYFSPSHLINVRNTIIYSLAFI